MMRFTFLSTSVASVALVAATLLGPQPALSQTNPCAGLTGAAFGLCNAYCRAVDCPAGHNGNSCASLRKNWQKLTGNVLFPCDAVCCECENGARACSTAKRCRQATQCSIVDRCVDGQCPSACPCGANCVVDGAAGVCSQVAGATDCRCVPAQPTATPTPTPTPACPCGATCTDAAGAVGRCEPTDAQPNDCACVVRPTPTPTPACPCGATCTDDAGAVGRCEVIDPTRPNDCECVVQPTPTPAVECPCGAPCTDANGLLGSCVTAAGANVCVCAANTPAIGSPVLRPHGPH